MAKKETKEESADYMPFAHQVEALQIKSKKL